MVSAICGVYAALPGAADCRQADQGTQRATQVFADARARRALVTARAGLSGAEQRAADRAAVGVRHLAAQPQRHSRVSAQLWPGGRSAVQLDAVARRAAWHAPVHRRSARHRAALAGEATVALEAREVRLAIEVRLAVLVLHLRSEARSGGVRRGADAHLAWRTHLRERAETRPTRAAPSRTPRESDRTPGGLALALEAVRPFDLARDAHARVRRAVAEPSLRAQAFDGRASPEREHPAGLARHWSPSRHSLSFSHAVPLVPKAAHLPTVGMNGELAVERACTRRPWRRGSSSSARGWQVRGHEEPRHTPSVHSVKPS